MKKLKFVIAAVATVIGLGGALANAEMTTNSRQTLDASSINGASSPNISLSQQDSQWTCTLGSQACYYTKNAVTGLYTVPSARHGAFHFIN